MKFNIASATNKGHRSYMEDFIFYVHKPKYIISGVTDGHGGEKTAKYIQGNFCLKFDRNFPKNNYNIAQTLRKTIQQIQTFVLRNKKTFSSSGATLNVIVVCKKRNKVYICNVGDSRAIMATSNNRCYQISKDHSLEDREERQSILENGGYIKDNRVNGVLNLSRAIGDGDVAKYISSKPDITTKQLQTKTYQMRFILQASDGLFDVMPNKQICEFIHGHLKQKRSPNYIANSLIHYALKHKKAVDNLCAILIVIS